MDTNPALVETYIGARSLSADRATAYRTLLREYAMGLPSRALTATDAHRVSEFLHTKLSHGNQPNTVRKSQAMLVRPTARDKGGTTVPPPMRSRAVESGP